MYPWDQYKGLMQDLYNKEQLAMFKRVIKLDHLIALDSYIGQESEGQVVSWESDNYLYYFGVVLIGNINFDHVYFE
jgi:hypothetical protein